MIFLWFFIFLDEFLPFQINEHFIPTVGLLARYTLEKEEFLQINIKNWGTLSGKEHPPKTLSFTYKEILNSIK